MSVQLSLRLAHPNFSLVQKFGSLIRLLRIIEVRSPLAVVTFHISCTYIELQKRIIPVKTLQRSPNSLNRYRGKHSINDNVDRE